VITLRRRTSTLEPYPTLFRSSQKKGGTSQCPLLFLVSASGGFSHFALLAQAEIAFDDTRIARQFFSLALEHHLSRFEHIAIIGHLERSACVLLHQQDGNACAAQTSDDMEDFAHNTRSQPQARFIKHQ